MSKKDTAAGHNRRVGTKDNSFAYIDSTGHGVRWSTLRAEAKRGLKHFWSKRGGEPRTSGNDFLFSAKVRSK